jgi:hypothetical protein
MKMLGINPDNPFYQVSSRTFFALRGRGEPFASLFKAKNSGVYQAVHLAQHLWSLE